MKGATMSQIIMEGLLVYTGGLLLLLLFVKECLLVERSSILIDV